MIRELLLSPGKNRVAFEALHTSGTTEIESAPPPSDTKVEPPVSATVNAR